MTTIFMISCETRTRDRDNYFNGTSTIDPDEGYFTDRADAQARIDVLNARLVAEYAAYSARVRDSRSFDHWLFAEEHTSYEIVSVEPAEKPVSAAVAA
jgi:hypothetical protein